MTTPSDLIEEVAKAMLRTLGWTNPQIEYARKHRSSAWLDTMSQSRAAAAVIIEACAQVADGYEGSSFPSKAAAAIRALAAPAKPEGA